MVCDVDGICGGGRFKLGGCGMMLTGSSATYDACEGWVSDGCASNGWMSSSGSGTVKSS